MLLTRVLATRVSRAVDEVLKLCLVSNNTRAGVGQQFFDDSSACGRKFERSEEQNGVAVKQAAASELGSCLTPRCGTVFASKNEAFLRNYAPLA